MSESKEFGGGSTRSVIPQRVEVERAAVVEPPRETPPDVGDEAAVDRFMREVFDGTRKPSVTEYALALRARAEKSLRLDAEYALSAAQRERDAWRNAVACGGSTPRTTEPLPPSASPSSTGGGARNG